MLEDPLALALVACGACKPAGGRSYDDMAREIREFLRHQEIVIVGVEECRTPPVGSATTNDEGTHDADTAGT